MKPIKLFFFLLSLLLVLPANAAPTYSRMEAEGTGRARLFFDDVVGSLKPAGTYLTGFQMAGGDGIFYPASAYVDNDEEDQLIVICDALCNDQAAAVKYTGGTLTDYTGDLVQPFSTNKDLVQPNFTTVRNLLLCGYQAWFNCPSDPVNRGWSHYNNGGAFKPGQCGIEYWPDMTEYTKTYNTDFTYPDGSKATIFSSADQETLDLHFQWMKDYDIDGAVIQRFKSSVEDRPWTKDVLKKTIAAAEKAGRAYFIEYDLSGLSGGESVSKIIDDWNALCDEVGVNDPSRCPNYVWENGKPLVGFFGVGLNKSNTSTPDQYLTMFNTMKGKDNEEGAIAIFAGTGYYWRVPDANPNTDAKPLSDWQQVYERCDVISPWQVGRNSTTTTFTQKRSQVISDLRWCAARNIVYMPVAFPGFSWRNLKTSYASDGTPTFPENAPYDQIPRLGGTFFKTQLDKYKDWGMDAVFVAMFDEMDEGTAIFKLTTKDNTPSNASSVNPDGKFLSTEDGLESDHYLKLAGEAARNMKQ